MFPIDYRRAADYTEQFEQRVVNRLSTGTPVGRRTVLGRLGVAGNRILTSVGRSLASSSDGHDNDGGNFEAVGEYAESRFDLIDSFKTHSQFVDKCLESYMRSLSNSKTTTEVAQTRNSAAALEVAP
jgi:hypothetical protein